LFDIVIEVQKRGRERVGIVRKTRVKQFDDGEQFPFSYEEIANKYGRDILERAATAVKLASPEQVTAVKTLLEERDATKANELREKWLDKAGADKWEEMPYDAMEKIINYLGHSLTERA
jgi:hypothetical protein